MQLKWKELLKEMLKMEKKKRNKKGNMGKHETEREGEWRKKGSGLKQKRRNKSRQGGQEQRMLGEMKVCISPLPPLLPP